MTAEVTLTMSVSRAQAVKSALELFSRLSIGQIESVTEMLRHGDIPRRGDSSSPRALPTIDQIESIDALLMEAKSILGYSRGGSLWVGNPHVTEAGHLAWETYKELSRALAVHRNPAPSFRGVDYDGNLLRYTQEPLPVATVQEAAAQPRLTCPDQGACHHRCVTPCARRDRLGCSPLSGSGLDERWQPITQAGVQS